MIFNSLELKCTFSNDGCPEVYTLEMFKMHEENCFYKNYKQYKCFTKKKKVFFSILCIYTIWEAKFLKLKLA